MNYGLDMTIRDVLAEQDTAEALRRLLPGVAERAGQSPATANLSIRKLVEYMGGRLPQAALVALEAELKCIGRENGGLSKGERARIESYKQLAARAEADWQEKLRRPERFDRDRFTPGRPWLDTRGERIQAHGGALRFENGTYYWYGENKQFTDGASRIWHWGVRVYSSKDLYNWTDLGLIIPPVLDDPDSNLFPESRMTRPHIVRCEKTGRYVCWLVVAGNDACFAVLESSALTGPYTLVKEHYRPFGHRYSDFDIAVDEQGVGWMLVDVDHSTILGFRLSEDMLSLREQVSASYEGLHPPFCREAASVFSRGGKKYMLSSGMSGYLPNGSDAAVSEGWGRPFHSQGDPYVGDETGSSFNSQFTQIFSLPGRKDGYIALSDRWNATFLMDAHRVEVTKRVIAAHYAPDKYPVTDAERKEYGTYPSLHETNTSLADYVWLPLVFEGDRVRIEWRDSWRWEELGEPLQ